jgi:protein-arginine kinase activator protein McsA
MSERDVCDNCGSETFSEGHFAVGKLWCAECWSGRKPAVAMPPSPAQRKQFELWISPRREGAQRP